MLVPISSVFAIHRTNSSYWKNAFLNWRISEDKNPYLPPLKAFLREFLAERGTFSL
jgi:hypothetical protein